MQYVLDGASQVQWATGGIESLGGSFSAYNPTCCPSFNDPDAASNLVLYGFSFQSPSGMLKGYSGIPVFNSWNFIDLLTGGDTANFVAQPPFFIATIEYQELSRTPTDLLALIGTLRLDPQAPGSWSPTNVALPDSIALNLILYESVVHLTIDSQGRTVFDLVQPDTVTALFSVVAHQAAVPEPSAACLLGATGIAGLLARSRRKGGSPLPL